MALQLQAPTRLLAKRAPGARLAELNNLVGSDGKIPSSGSHLLERDGVAKAFELSD